MIHFFCKLAATIYRYKIFYNKSKNTFFSQIKSRLWDINLSFYSISFYSAKIYFTNTFSKYKISVINFLFWFLNKL